MRHSFNCVEKVPNAVKYFYGIKLLLQSPDRLVIGIGKYARDNVLAMGAHAFKIDLCLGDPSRSPKRLGIGPWTGDFVRHRLNRGRERRVGRDGDV